MFNSKKVLITGGSSGIGYELAKLFLAEGAQVAILGSNPVKLSQAAERLEKEFKTHVIQIAQDLSRLDAAERVQKTLHGKNFEVDVLVNNAGFGVYGDFSISELEKQMGMIDVNLRVLVDLTHRLIQPMVRKRSGWILNVASTAAFQAIPSEAIYAATKGFVLLFSEGLHVELQKQNISVTCLCPGATDTPFFERGTIAPSKIMRRNMMKSDTVAKIGFEGLKKNKPLVIPGIANKVTTHGQRLVPRSFVAQVAKKIVETRYAQ